MSEELERQELNLDLPAAHSAGRMARQVVGKFASENGILEDDIGTLELVASELLSNAVDHGGGGSAMDESDLTSDVRMKLRLQVNATGWELRVADQGGGAPSDMAPYLDDSELPDLEDERGRGFFLLIQMVDKLSVIASEDGKGLEFIARKSVG